MAEKDGRCGSEGAKEGKCVSLGELRGESCVEREREREREKERERERERELRQSELRGLRCERGL